MKMKHKKEMKDDMLAKVLSSIIDSTGDTTEDRMKKKGIKVIELNIHDLNMDEDEEHDNYDEEGIESDDLLGKLKKKARNKKG